MARRIYLNDGSGKSFNIDAAVRFGSNYFFDGRNMICAATSSQWEHEALYRTKRGRWVLHWQSNWQGVPDRWWVISEEVAMRWLKKNNPEAWEKLQAK